MLEDVEIGHEEVLHDSWVFDIDEIFVGLRRIVCEVEGAK